MVFSIVTVKTIRQGTEEGAANGCSFAEKTGILYRFEMKLIWGLWDCNILQCFFALGKMLFGTSDHQTLSLFLADDSPQ